MKRKLEITKLATSIPMLDFQKFASLRTNICLQPRLPHVMTIRPLDSVMMRRGKIADMNIVEKILARSSNLEKVQPGDVVVVKVETAVTLDMAYYLADGKPHHPVKLWDPEKVITIHDHISPPKDVKTAEAVLKSRKFVQHYGIPRFHDVGSTQGIVHQVIQDEGYALPGTVLVCNDSHTCSSGAFNCCARGIGVADLTYVLCTGETWFKVGETIRYELIGMLSEFVTAKDVFLYIAGNTALTLGKILNLAVLLQTHFLLMLEEPYRPCVQN